MQEIHHKRITALLTLFGMRPASISIGVLGLLLATLQAPSQGFVHDIGTACTAADTPTRVEANPESVPATNTGLFADGSLLTPARICKASNENQWASVSGFCHLLMFYRLDKTDLPDFPTGMSMLKALTDEPTAVKVFGESPFIRTRNGLRYSLLKDQFSQIGLGEAHRDQCLATFAELDLPLNTLIRLTNGTFSVSNLISEAIANFDSDEKEPAWTAIAFAKYITPKTEWENRFHQKTSFSQLVEQLLHVDFDTQSCGGTHILEALGLIASADRAHPILTDPVREKLRVFVESTLREAIARQQPDGRWHKRWCNATKSSLNGVTTDLETDLLVTGHLVTILREVDSTHIIPRSVYERSVAWLQNVTTSSTTSMDARWLCPFTHAVVSVREFKKLE